MEKTFTFEKCSNMVFCTSETGSVWYAWDETEFTERKRQNAIAKLKKLFNGKVVFFYNY